MTDRFISAPGLHPGVPESEYHRRTLGVVSKSALDLVHRSPAHYKAWVDGVLPDDDSPALEFGRAFHCAMLEPERFAARYVAEPDFGDCRFKENKKRRDDWREENAGKHSISADDYASIVGMVNAVRAHPLASRMVSDGEPELTLSWKDADTGLMCKSRLDYYVRERRMIVDVKSTMDAGWESFRKDVAKYRYHVQDALYRAAASAIGEPVQYFVFVAVEKVLPHAVALFSLDADGIGKGYTAARRDIDTLAECMRRNEWPGYPPGIQEIDLPPWAA